ncbi:hypothetical protein MNBD_PLANCTO02-2299 [hydrothermal vent metagenome]|uniref:Uncharacterized protein n=1 Tax=hydrothermal vent metagenome TaxID=652676 RepID=A0A3B1DWZ1_9ZZZZ
MQEFFTYELLTILFIAISCGAAFYIYATKRLFG